MQVTQGQKRDLPLNRVWKPPADLSLLPGVGSGSAHWVAAPPAGSCPRVCWSLKELPMAQLEAEGTEAWRRGQFLCLSLCPASGAVSGDATVPWGQGRSGHSTHT